MTRFNFLSLMILCLGATGLLSVSCINNMDDESYLGSMSVTVEAPEEYPDMSLSGLTVSILNTADGVTYTQTADENGTALFDELVAGTYNITVTGTYENFTVNGVKNGVLVSAQEMTDVVIMLTAVDTGHNSMYDGLIIKELFYSGHSMDYDIAGATMLKDHFFELYNNGDDAFYLDGIYIADAWTPVTGDFDSAPELSMLEDPTLDHDYVYASRVIRVPGSGEEHLLEPGESFLVAINAINFQDEVRSAAEDYGMSIDQTQLDHIIDLSVADMETYMVTWLQSQGRTGNDYFDLDNPDVPNMDNIYLADPYDFFFLESTGCSLIVFKPEEELSDDDIIIYSYIGGERQTNSLL